MTEREQFEAWANGTGFSTNRQDNDNYLYSATRGAWEAWQAARAQPAQAVPVLTDNPLFVFAREVIHGAYRPEELKDAAMRAIRHHSAQPAQAVPSDVVWDAAAKAWRQGFRAGSEWRGRLEQFWRDGDLATTSPEQPDNPYIAAQGEKP